MVDPAAARCDRVARAVVPQFGRGMGSDGGRRGALSKRRRGRVSVPDPIEWVVQIAFGNQELLYQKIAGAGCCFQGRPMAR